MEGAEKKKKRKGSFLAWKAGLGGLGKEKESEKKEFLLGGEYLEGEKGNPGEKRPFSLKTDERPGSKGKRKGAA